VACKSRTPAEYILGRIDSWSNLRWPRAANLIKVKSSQDLRNQAEAPSEIFRERNEMQPSDRWVRLMK
jgi:hypothetical protein